jgi:pectate lyase
MSFDKWKAVVFGLAALALVSCSEDEHRSGSDAETIVSDADGAAVGKTNRASDDGTILTEQDGRAALGTDAALASLVDSAGALRFDPSSSSTEYSYGIADFAATNYTVTPTAKDPNASITVDGTAVKSGSASAPIDLSAGSAAVVITVMAENGVTSLTVTLHITVTHAVTGLTLSTTSIRLDTVVSKSTTLTAIVAPADATDRAVTWASADPAVVTVDASGMVSAAGLGQTVVTATSHDGGFIATCTVYVLAVWLYDDFETGTDKWDLLPVSGPNGAFAQVADGSTVLQYAAATVGGVVATVKDTVWSGISGDYYFEARVKPQSNATTVSKQLFLIARYQDDKNWYAAGLNMQSSTASTQVEIAKMAAGSLSRPGQAKRPIVMDTAWVTVRFELKGSTLTVYLDGELVTSVTDQGFTAGKIGLYTNNKSFEIDDVKVGDPNDRPVQLTVSPNTSWNAEVGDAPRVISVNAQKPNYMQGSYETDTFSAVSSDPVVVSTAVEGNQVTLTALSPGTAAIIFTSGSNLSLTRVIEATVSPPFVQPSATYDLTGKTRPAVGEAAAYIDTRLELTFDAPPALGTAGSVRIFKKSDDSLVDVVRLGDETNCLGYTGQDQVRVVKVEPTGMINVSGNTLIIYPHNDKLAYATQYYVAIADGTVSGTISGAAFGGIGKAAGWSFTTKAALASSLTALTVDDDGAADFRTVQGALNYFMKNAPKDTAVTVNVKNGIYRELLFLRGKNNLTIAGESRDGVVIHYKNDESLNGGSGSSQVAGSGTPNGGRAVFLAESSDMLTLKALTLKNTTLRSTGVACQAETIYFNHDAGRLIAKNAAFLSEQDTLQLKGYSWFYQTVVEGNVDFIWGGNRVSLFEESEIRTVGDTSNASSGGYIVQARTVTAGDKGFVFLNSKLTHGPGPGPAHAHVPFEPTGVTYLARSPGGTSSYDNVAFINCQMDTHIIAVGWAYGVNNQPMPNPATATAVSGWREYGSTDLNDNPIDLDKRVGGYELTSTEYRAGFRNRTQIFAGYNSGAGWDPQP